MMKLMVMLLLVGMSLAADEPNNAVKEEHQRLDGTWIVESIVRDPREANADEGKGIRCVIKGDKLVAKLPGEERSAGSLKLKIDPTKNPKTVDLRPDGENTTLLAIYELKGDTLRVSWKAQGMERPRELGSAPGSAQTVVTLKREKP